MNEATLTTHDNMPEISVLIPCFNVERYLEECLDSLLEQTFGDFEAICINDGSTDSTLNIINSYAAKDPRFRCLDKANSGYGASMNAGMKLAQGKYLCILESDDFFDKDALQVLHSAISNGDNDVAKANFYLYWSTPQEKDELFSWVKKGENGPTTPKENPGVYYRKPSIWSAIYKMDFLQKNEISFLETPGASYQDAGFNFKVWAAADRIALIEQPILHYRQDNESSSVNSPGKVYCVCDEYQEMKRYLAQRDASDRKRLTPVLVKMRYDSYMWNYERLSEPLQREFVLRMQKDFLAEDEAGLTDYALFEPWKVEDRRAIMADPILFHSNHMNGIRPGKLNTAIRLFKLGGISLVVKALASKLR